ncbi:MAG TPA: alanyl-tRNA editing protein [Polyangiaceae bacterium]|nr:alanyl-tRNA editing protein [Polyangiaceae bacterium]
MTHERLEQRDGRCVSFSAEVTDLGGGAGGPSIVLSRTAFYPESGGQLADRGTLNGVPVLDVQLDEAGRVHHVVADASAFAPGAPVEGRVDWSRRRLHRSLHTAQHMLSRALFEEAGAETVSSRLGSSATLDLAPCGLDEAALARAERLVNELAFDHRPVRVLYPSPAELAALPLRKAPTVSEGVRVIDIDGFDLTPCGGTHCESTAEVGVVRVTGLERHKGGFRVTFVAGERGLDDYRAKDRALAELARQFTCGPGDVGAAIEKLRRELADARAELGDLRSRWARSVGAGLLEAARRGAAGERVVVAVFDDLPAELLRALATAFGASEGALAFLAARGPEGLSAVVARGPGVAFDCGAWLRRASAAAGGRGGGRPERAEGRLPAQADWAALVEREAAGATA